MDVETSTDTDADLIRSVSRGDRGALAAVFDRHAATVTRYAWAVASSRQDVEEIVQDTFVTLWQKSQSIELPTGSALPWLLVTCRNHAMNLIRRRARTQSDELPEHLPAHEDHAEARERLRWVRAEIEALDPVDRRVCELCLLDGYSYTEAAEALGLSVGAVTKRVSRSLARLRKVVSDDEH